VKFDVVKELANILAGSREVAFASELFQARPKERKHMWAIAHQQDADL
jgi:hypothetical protein